jgi:spore coat polysaccharide biosynthesis predicted glycosyltransferase SpsG
MTRPAPGASSPRRLRLLLRLDANATTGLGHGVRTAGIVAAMPQAHDIIVVGEGDALATLFPNATVINRAVGARELAELARASNVDGVIVDLPSYTNEVWDSADFSGKPLVLIDDWGGPMKADLIVSGAISEQSHSYPNTERVLHGPQYCLIRPVFGGTPWRNPNRTSVTLVAGSGPEARDWVDLVTSDQIDRSAWSRFTVVVGQTFMDIDGLAWRCQNIGAILKTGLAAQQLADLLAASHVALVTGGMIVYEALAVGVPTVVFPQIPNLAPEAAWFAAQGCIHNLGPENGMKAEVVSGAVTRLLKDRALAKDMASRGRQIIDGQGMIRVATAITELLHTSG